MCYLLLIFASSSHSTPSGSQDISHTLLFSLLADETGMQSQDKRHRDSTCTRVWTFSPLLLFIGSYMSRKGKYTYPVIGARRKDEIQGENRRRTRGSVKVAKWRDGQRENKNSLWVDEEGETEEITHEEHPNDAGRRERKEVLWVIFHPDAFWSLANRLFFSPVPSL